MAKPDSRLREGSMVKHRHFGAGKIVGFLHDGKTTVIETTDKKTGVNTHYAKTEELKRVEAPDGD